MECLSKRKCKQIAKYAKKLARADMKVGYLTSVPVIESGLIGLHILKVTTVLLCETGNDDVTSGWLLNSLVAL